MYKASTVFLVIGVISCVVGLILATVGYFANDNALILGILSLVCIYGLIVTIGALIALSSRSMRASFIFAILCFVIAPIASIFMFFIDEREFVPEHKFRKSKKGIKEELAKPIVRSLKADQFVNLPFDGILRKNYLTADDYGESVSIKKDSMVKIVGYHKATDTCTIEIKDGDFLRTVRQIPSSYIGIICKEKDVLEINKIEPDSFPCEGLMLSRYFGADEKGKNISIEKDSKITIMSFDKSLSTYKIKFTENKTTHCIDNIPSFYVKKITN